MTDLENFEKLASGLQHVVTAAGIVVGGVWVLYTFWGQHVVQKATLDVAKTEREIKKIEQDSLQQPVLHTAIHPGVTTDDGYPVSMIVTFRNEGRLALSYEHAELSLMLLSDKEQLSAEKAKPIRIKAKVLGSDGTLSDMPFRVLRVGQERSIAFALPKLAPGTYFVELRAKYAGMQIINGLFLPSSDETIEAVDQTIIRAPVTAEPKIHSARNKE